MATEEGEGAGLRPRVPPPKPFEEAHMSALLDEGCLEPARLRHRVAGQGGARHEGIVQGVDQERGPANAGKELRAARAIPVVLLVGEAMKGRRDEAIVLGEGLRLEGGGQVEHVAVEMAAAAATWEGAPSPRSPSHLSMTLPPSETPTMPTRSWGSREVSRKMTNSRSPVSPE